MIRRPPISPLFPYPPLSRSEAHVAHRCGPLPVGDGDPRRLLAPVLEGVEPKIGPLRQLPRQLARRSEEHTSELQSRQYLVCRLLLEKKKSQYCVRTVLEDDA